LDEGGVDGDEEVFFVPFCSCICCHCEGELKLGIKGLSVEVER
jgi:hypothetical protein